MLASRKNIESMHIALCADASALPGLHVAAYSLLARMAADGAAPCFHVFSETLGQADLALLDKTLSRTSKPFGLEHHRIDESVFKTFPSLHGSRATYYRLLAAAQLDVDRFLYVDVDTLCDLDVRQLSRVPMGGAPAGLVPEGPLDSCVDRSLARQLGGAARGLYFNAGVMLVSVAEWRARRVTERCLEFLAANEAMFHDQSALNSVLRDELLPLDCKFNFRTNVRHHWPALRAPWGAIGKLVHFVDYPKPWSPFAEWVHPQYGLWRQVLARTAMSRWSSIRPLRMESVASACRSHRLYRRALKDRVLFAGYRSGWLRRVKGVPGDEGLSVAAPGRPSQDHAAVKGGR